jgi:Zn finger protein HypA/HybF involved in hydrogenase expression
MRPGETVRFACHDCQIVFDLTVAPVSEWVEELDESDSESPMEVESPVQCPFCESMDLHVTHDRPLSIKPD